MSIIIATLILVVTIPSIAIDILLPALPEIATFLKLIFHKYNFY